MRPDILNPLFVPINSFHGIGPKLFQWLTKLCGDRSKDILWHLPSDVKKRNVLQSFPRQPVLGTIKITVTQHKIPRLKRQPLVVFAVSDLGEVQLIFFHYHVSFLDTKLTLGSTVWVSGTIVPEGEVLKIVHPDYIVNEISQIPQNETIYPLNAGLNGKVIRKLVAQILPTLPDLPEEIDSAFVQQKGWPSWKNALVSLHNPQTEEDLSPCAPARERLAFDELFANQIALHLIRNYQKKQKGKVLLFKNKYKLDLPFQLTSAQERCLKEIREDLSSSSRMNRLLQGDVGSGKTIIALMAALQAVENDTQSAFLAPTDILARQHFEKIQKLCEKFSLNVALLTAREKGKKRDQLLNDLAIGKINILIGTHAILEENVHFKCLGLAVIDEQHRFGVAQRLALIDKEKDSNILVMTATPIPRTLALTAYGDMDISVLDEKPAGRQAIETRVLSLSKVTEVIQHLKTINTQVYWVCPLVAESEKTDLMAAEKRYQALKQIFGNDVGLIHGKMKAEDKEVVMAQFLQKKIKILVSTTVIEVGVDVPAANIMIVEHAERFGLATLHQLRGRVGRGQDKACCVLMHGRLSDIAKERLKILHDSQDGFRIAEADLKLRGAGEVLGLRQSGLPLFCVADIVEHADLLRLANQEAVAFLKEDPLLQTNRGQALKNMLYLFSKDKAIPLLKAG